MVGDGSSEAIFPPKHKVTGGLSPQGGGKAAEFAMLGCLRVSVTLVDP